MPFESSVRSTGVSTRDWPQWPDTPMVATFFDSAKLASVSAARPCTNGVSDRAPLPGW